MMFRQKGQNTATIQWMVFVFVALVVAASIALIAVATLRDPAETQSAYGTAIEKAKFGSEKTIQMHGKDIKLTYVHTANLRETARKKRADSYGTYDVYEDAEGTEYRYLYETERLCAYVQPDAYGKWMTPNVSDEDVQALCTAFLKGNVNYGVPYTYESMYYAENFAIFDVTYVYMLNGLRTDDRCVFWVQGDGNIAAYMMYNNGRYTAYADVFWDAEKTDAAFGQAMQKNGKAYELDDRYVSKNDAGELVMVYEVFYPDQNYMDVLQFKLEAVRAA